jgi:hypothetical protein
MKKSIIVITVLFLQFSFGQIKDSTKVIEPFRLNRYTQIKTSNCLRVGIGAQKSFQTEIGFSRMTFITGCTGFFSKSYYSSVEYTPKTGIYNPIFGLKVGFEANLSIIAVAIETKYQTNFEDKNFVITPKIGIGVGYINLMYGYGVSVNKNPFPNIGNHQLHLIFNLPLKK